MAEQKLKHVMSRGFAFAATVGAVIGLGIMRTPGEIATTIADPWLYIGFWAVAGLVCLASLAVVSELIGTTPLSGGTYVYLRHAFGQFPAFVVGWADWISICAARALHGVVIMEFLTLLFPFVKPFTVEGALAITSAFALVQIVGPSFTARIQEVAAVVGAVVLIAVSGALLYGGFILPDVDIAVINIGTSPPALGAYALALSAIIFTYDGWFVPAFFNGEMKIGPRETISGAFRGFAVIMVLYLAVNTALLLSVPIESLQGHELALAGALEALYGATAASIVIGSAILILFGQQNTGYMLASRVIYALSVDGFAYRGGKRLNGRGAPIGAVAVSWLLICALIIVGGFEFLLTFVGFLLTLSTVALMAGVIRLRFVEPNANRIYSSWGYPWLSCSDNDCLGRCGGFYWCADARICSLRIIP